MAASAIFGILSPAYSWPPWILVLVLTSIAFAISRSLSRPAWPSSAPKYLVGLPFLGSLDFFRCRLDFLRKCNALTKTGNFSFFYGNHPIVGLFGVEARKTFFTTRGLDLNEGFNTLFAASPNIDHLYKGEGTIFSHFLALFKRFTHKDRLSANLPDMVQDIATSFNELEEDVPFDPFVVLYKLVYQLTHRTLGSNDIANDPKLLRDTLNIYMGMDDSHALQVMFPSIPFPSRLSKTWAGIKLYWIFKKLMDERRRTGRSESDAMQVMMDSGDDDIIISSFIIGALFAGLINTGVNAAWILCYLGQNEFWQAKVRQEINAAITNHRLSEHESAADTISRFTLDDWEKSFPTIDLCLRESIRLIMPGSMIRKNISGKNVNILGSNEIIPKDAFAVYPLADVHLDPDIYTDPFTWDPARYLPEREEDKKQEHAYLGWGTGLHPCVGMRFAKLEITISTVMFLAHYNFKVCDKKGNTESVKLPQLNHNGFAVHRPHGQIYLKCVGITREE